MANLEEQILRRYGVDIRQIQLLKLYHLDKPDAEHLTANQMEEIFLKRRSLWQKALNNPNEKVSGPARQHLEAASRYEAILRDGELRKELEQ